LTLGVAWAPMQANLSRQLLSHPLIVSIRISFVI
jgi:hypothetical protein